LTKKPGTFLNPVAERVSKLTTVLKLTGDFGLGVLGAEFDSSLIVRF
jgi:hypothetical protein